MEMTLDDASSRLRSWTFLLFFVQGQERDIGNLDDLEKKKIISFGQFIELLRALRNKNSWTAAEGFAEWIFDLSQNLFFVIT